MQTAAKPALAPVLKQEEVRLPADNPYKPRCRGLSVVETVIAISIGAILGALARFAFTHLSSTMSHHHGFPYGTLAVNVLGSFIVGFVLTWSSNHSNDYWRLLMATGFCGAFTTFSAFAYESIGYLREQQYATFAINVGLNNVLSMFAVWAGVLTHVNGRR